MAIRGRGDGDLGISLRPVGDSNGSTVDHHKVFESLAYRVDIKADTIGDVEAHGHDGSSPFVQSKSETNSRVVDTEYELESGRPSI
jgi:hypothetical protein